MQVVLSATSSRLYCVQGDFQMSTDTLVQNILLGFWFLSLLHQQYTFLWNSTYGVVKDAKQSLPLQLGFERFQYISINQG